MSLPAYVTRGSLNKLLRQMMGHLGLTVQLVATGGTVTTVVVNPTTVLLATGAITTWNVTMPVKPPDETEFVIGAPGGAVTTLSLTTSTLVGTSPTSIAQNVSYAFKYHAATNTWYRIR